MHFEAEGSRGVEASTTVRMSYSDMLELLKSNIGSSFKYDKMINRLPIFK